ncbi:MAG: hypothetical protein M1839_000939, partial [Geoglossum umbratile]
MLRILNSTTCVVWKISSLAHTASAGESKSALINKFLAPKGNVPAASIVRPDTKHPVTAGRVGQLTRVIEFPLQSLWYCRDCRISATWCQHCITNAPLHRHSIASFVPGSGGAKPAAGSTPAASYAILGPNPSNPFTNGAARTAPNNGHTASPSCFPPPAVAPGPFSAAPIASPPFSPYTTTTPRSYPPQPFNQPSFSPPAQPAPNTFSQARVNPPIPISTPSGSRASLAPPSATGQRPNSPSSIFSKVIHSKYTKMGAKFATRVAIAGIIGADVGDLSFDSGAGDSGGGDNNLFDASTSGFDAPV